MLRIQGTLSTEEVKAFSTVEYEEMGVVSTEVKEARITSSWSYDLVEVLMEMCYGKEIVILVEM